MRSSTPLPSRWLRRRRAPGSRGSLRSCGSLASGCCRRQLQATRVMLSSRRRSIFLNRRSRGSRRNSMSMLPLLTRTARVIKGSSSRSSGSAGPRPVCLLRGAVEDMVQVVEHTDGVAELRRPHQPGFFTGTRRSEQIEWIEDLLSRGGPIPDDAPAVCVLDTGVQREHRLLTDALDGADCHRADAQWRPDPVCPHGTEMAGPALYGDLESAPASFVGYEPIAPAGDLAPTSRTSASFAHTGWPFKPDVVADGGNLLRSPDGGTVDRSDHLTVLTTRFHHLGTGSFLTGGFDASAAAATFAPAAASVQAAYPALRPETVRGLVVHSARWTDAMHAHQSSRKRPPKGEPQVLRRRYGMGVPDLERALRSASDALTLVCEGELHPQARASAECRPCLP